ncbi:SRPBCC family protein [Azotobacter chroococcum]
MGRLHRQQPARRRRAPALSGNGRRGGYHRAPAGVQRERAPLQLCPARRPTPVSDYLGRVSVRDDGEGRSLATWSSRFRSEKANEVEIATDLESFYRTGLERLKAMFEAQQPVTGLHERLQARDHEVEEVAQSHCHAADDSLTGQPIRR